MIAMLPITVENVTGILRRRRAQITNRTEDIVYNMEQSTHRVRQLRVQHIDWIIQWLEQNGDQHNNHSGTPAVNYFVGFVRGDAESLPDRGAENLNVYVSENSQFGRYPRGQTCFNYITFRACSTYEEISQILNELFIEANPNLLTRFHNI